MDEDRQRENERREERDRDGDEKCEKHDGQIADRPIQRGRICHQCGPRVEGEHEGGGRVGAVRVEGTIQHLTWATGVGGREDEYAQAGDGHALEPISGRTAEYAGRFGVSTVVSEPGYECLPRSRESPPAGGGEDACDDLKEEEDHEQG